MSEKIQNFLARFVPMPQFCRIAAMSSWSEMQKKTAELNFDQHEELITELYPLSDLKTFDAEIGTDYPLDWAQFTFDAFIELDRNSLDLTLLKLNVLLHQPFCFFTELFTIDMMVVL